MKNTKVAKQKLLGSKNCGAIFPQGAVRGLAKANQADACNEELGGKAAKSAQAQYFV